MKKIAIMFCLLIPLIFSGYSQKTVNLTPDTAGTITGLADGRTHYFKSPVIYGSYGWSVELVVTTSGTHATDSTTVFVEGSTDNTNWTTITTLGTPWLLGTAKYRASTYGGYKLSSEGTGTVGWVWQPGTILTSRYIRLKITQYKAGSILTVDKAKLHVYTINIASKNTNAASYYVDTANNQNVRGVKTFYSPIYNAIGNSSLGYNTAMGYEALKSRTSGDQNAAYGTHALYSATTGYQNTGLGFWAGANVSTGNNNTFIGNTSGSQFTTGNSNVGLGFAACKGGIAGATGSSNIGIGESALVGLTSGGYNIGIGTEALYTNHTANSNIGIGYQSLYSNTGNSNTAIAYQSLTNNDNGVYNSSFGYRTLYNNTSGQHNVAAGISAGNGNKSGSDNIYLGPYSGPAGTTSTLSNRLYISNIVGGADTAIIYGIMNGTPATNTLQLNAATTTQKLTIQADTAVTDPLYTIAVKSGHVYVKISTTGATSARWKQIDN